MVLAVLKDANVTPVITSMDVILPYIHQVKMQILAKKDEFIVAVFTCIDQF